MRATVGQAVWALDQGHEAAKEVAVATWWATDAGERIQHTVQHLHGGLGADTTYPVHRRLLWTMRANALLGGPSRQLARLGTLLS
jgi:acyl-CoA dehydrogenase